MKNVITAGLALSLMAGSLIALSQPADAKNWGVNGRQWRQQQRIQQGVCNGSLTNREAARMERQQYKLAKQERRMRASGGGLSWQERSRLEREQNHLSNHIYNQKHDGQNR
jgi:hypothetical protein